MKAAKTLPEAHQKAHELLDYVSMAMKQTANQSTVLLYAPGMDSSLEEIASRADRVFYFEPVVVVPAKRTSRGKQKGVPEDQTTLGAF